MDHGTTYRPISVIIIASRVECVKIGLAGLDADPTGDSEVAFCPFYDDIVAMGSKGAS